MAVLPLLCVGAVSSAVQRRWWSMVMIVVTSPLTLHFGIGVHDYSQGAGSLRYMGYPGVESNNISAVFRCERRTRGCVVRGGELLRIVPYNAALRLMISMLGPMRGSYVGPYPTKSEALNALETGQEIPVREVVSESVTLGRTTVALKAGLANELLGRTEWMLAWTEPDEQMFDEESFGV